MIPSVARISTGLAALAVAAACHRAAPSARERVLAALPGDAVAVAVADGRALSHPRIRGALEVLAPRWPASLGCVLDAAVASDAVGVAIDAAGNLTAIAVLRTAPRCPALSQREPGLWIATLGAGPSVTAPPVLGEPRFARARPYLETSPVAAAVLGDVHLMAAAQPDPFDAWIALDVAAGADALAQTIADHIARLGREPATAALAARLQLARTGPTQLVVRLAGPLDADLSAAARTALAWADAAQVRAAPAAAAFPCPDPAPDVHCLDGTHYRVASLATDLSPILSVGRPTPIVRNGSVTGLRLDAAVRDLGLRAGDVVVAMAGRLVTSRATLADWIARARVATTMTIRRGAAETVLQFTEQPTE